MLMKRAQRNNERNLVNLFIFLHILKNSFFFCLNYDKWQNDIEK